MPLERYEQLVAKCAVLECELAKTRDTQHAREQNAQAQHAQAQHANVAPHAQHARDEQRRSDERQRQPDWRWRQPGMQQPDTARQQQQHDAAADADAQALHAKQAPRSSANTAAHGRADEHETEADGEFFDATDGSEAPGLMVKTALGPTTSTGAHAGATRSSGFEKNLSKKCHGARESKFEN